MNIIEWRNALCQDESVSPRGKHIGLTLSMFYREGKRTYPTIDTLCQWTSTTFNTVSSAIKDLIKAGYIEKKPFRFPNAKFMGTEYIFCGVTDCNRGVNNEPPLNSDGAFQGAIDAAIQGSKIDDKKEEIEEKNNKYKWQGKVIRLSKKDYEAWEKAYSNINLPSELQRLDDYYYENNVQKWYTRCSSALAKANKSTFAKKKEKPKRECGMSQMEEYLGWN